MSTYNRDAFFILHVSVPSGFEFLIPARGYNLKSWLNFEKNLGSTVTYEETTEEAYNHLLIGDPLDPLGEKYGPKSKRTAQQETAPKRGRRKTKSEDSEAARIVSEKPARATRSQPSKLRKPKVRDVSKSKKDAQGTNDTRKKTTTRTRTTKRQKE